jgi:hypothetical protein
MICELTLKEMLGHWIREYGPGGMPKEATRNFLQQIMDNTGRATGFRNCVPINTIGDEVESAIVEMTRLPAFPGEPNVMFKAAMVLRAYYLSPKHWPEDERIDALRRVGLPVSRIKFYEYVRLGRAFLMGYLNERKNAEAA